MNIWEEYTFLMHIVLTTNQKEECFYVHKQITPTHKLYIYVASSTNISDFYVVGLYNANAKYLMWNTNSTCLIIKFNTSVRELLRQMYAGVTYIKSPLPSPPTPPPPIYIE